MRSAHTDCDEDDAKVEPKLRKAEREKARRESLNEM